MPEHISIVKSKVPWGVDLSMPFPFCLKKVLLRAAFGAIMARVEDPDDFNRFSSSDCAGAIVMMGAVPTVLVYVFGDHDVLLSAGIMAAFLVLAAVVWVLAAVTRWRFIPVLVNWLGNLLAILYIILFFHMWPY